MPRLLADIREEMHPYEQGVVGEAAYNALRDLPAYEALYQEMLAHPATGKSLTYRGWNVTWDYGRYHATGPNYEASYQGEEDGWIASGGSVGARSFNALMAEIDAWIEEHPEDQA